MDIIKLKDENQLTELFNSDNLVVLDFYAEWCGPCSELAKNFTLIKEKVNNVSLVKVDVEDFDELSIKYNVLSMPTLVFTKHGMVVGKHVGMIDPSNLITLIEENKDK